MSNSRPKEGDVLPGKIGIGVDPAYSAELRNRIKDLLNWKHDGFPGSQPIALQHNNLQALEREDYFVCEKSDGVRYLMLLMVTQKGPATFMIDRKNEFHYVDMKFPLPKQVGEVTKYHNQTLLDGELVVDVEGSHRTLTYLVFDLLTSHGERHLHETYNRRLGFFQRDVLAPYEHYLKYHPEARNTQPFRIRIKTQQRSYGMHVVFDEIARQKHGNDGLIFTPVNLPYTPGTCHKLLKWKPPEQNTIDFKIKMDLDKDRKPHYSILIAEFGAHKLHDQLTLEPELQEKWRVSPPDGRIAEFRWDKNWMTSLWEDGYVSSKREGGWRFVRFRDDKDTANDLAVLEKTMKLIQNGVTKEMLLGRIDTIRGHWKAREQGVSLPPRPPPDRKFSTGPVPPTPALENAPSLEDPWRDGVMGIGDHGKRRLSSGSTTSDAELPVRRVSTDFDRRLSVESPLKPKAGETSPFMIDRRESADSDGIRRSSACSGGSEYRRSSEVFITSPTVEAGKPGDLLTKPQAVSKSEGRDVSGETREAEEETLPPRKRSLSEWVAQMPKGIRLKKIVHATSTESNAESPSTLEEDGSVTDTSPPTESDIKSPSVLTKVPETSESEKEAEVDASSTLPDMNPPKLIPSETLPMEDNAEATRVCQEVKQERVNKPPPTPNGAPVMWAPSPEVNVTKCLHDPMDMDTDAPSNKLAGILPTASTVSDAADPLPKACKSEDDQHAMDIDVKSPTGAKSSMDTETSKLNLIITSETASPMDLDESAASPRKVDVLDPMETEKQALPVKFKQEAADHSVHPLIFKEPQGPAPMQVANLIGIVDKGHGQGPEPPENTSPSGRRTSNGKVAPQKGRKGKASSPMLSTATMDVTDTATRASPHRGKKATEKQRKMSEARRKSSMKPYETSLLAVPAYTTTPAGSLPARPPGSNTSDVVTVVLPQPPPVLMQGQKKRVDDDDVYDEQESPAASPQVPVINTIPEIAPVKTEEVIQTPPRRKQSRPSSSASHRRSSSTPMKLLSQAGESMRTNSNASMDLGKQRASTSDPATLHIPSMGQPVPSHPSPATGGYPLGPNGVPLPHVFSSERPPAPPHTRSLSSSNVYEMQHRVVSQPHIQIHQQPSHAPMMQPIMYGDPRMQPVSMPGGHRLSIDHNAMSAASPYRRRSSVSQPLIQAAPYPSMAMAPTSAPGYPPGTVIQLPVTAGGPVMFYPMLAPRHPQPPGPVAFYSATQSPEGAGQPQYVAYPPPPHPASQPSAPGGQPMRVIQQHVLPSSHTAQQQQLQLPQHQQHHHQQHSHHQRAQQHTGADHKEVLSRYIHEKDQSARERRSSHYDHPGRRSSSAASGTNSSGTSRSARIGPPPPTYPHPPPSQQQQHQQPVPSTSPPPRVEAQSPAPTVPSISPSNRIPTKRTSAWLDVVMGTSDSPLPSPEDVGHKRAKG
ncbi:hypothetical protein SpCBS45565_g05002 [Spizellomyces sp. 'palustris']|nr:hypothetical protein SpCBS45565_g05002 [Spizellomyces sp. 'palustris']